MMIEDPELRELFKAESDEHLERLDEGLLRLENNTQEPAVLKELFREAHSLKGAARMLGVSNVETVAHCFEDLLGSASRGQLHITEEIMERMVVGLKAMARLVDEAVTGEPSGVSVNETLSLLRGESTPSRPSPARPEPVLETHSPTPLPEPVIRAAEPSPPAPVVTPAVAADPVVAPAQTMQPAPAVAPTPVVAPAPHQTEDSREVSWEEEKKRGDEDGYRIDTIRVETRKLDTLMSQAGELVVSKNRMKRRLAEIEELITLWEGHQGSADRELFDGMNDRLQSLRQSAFEDDANMELVAAELEEGIRSLRLLRISTLFNFFPRMVRDLAKEQGKQVKFLMEGGEADADKRIIEEMKDPLMHMIRNAIHHGIETPAERRALGKPEEGVIRLTAQRTASNVELELVDDGRGLDSAVIKEAAIKRRLFRQEELVVMSEAQIQALIFTPGFSTASMVTDVSGRGVGLDVVVTNVEQRLKGHIAVESEPRKGCRITVRLPISLTTTRVFLMLVEGRVFAMPVEMVQMVRRVPRREIFNLEGRETIAMEGEPVSVAHLADLLEIERQRQIPQAARMEEEPMFSCVILRVGEERLGVFIDQLIDEQEVVVKPHSGLVHRVRNISGAAILGDGEVCMVLHPQDLIRTVQQRRVPSSLTLQEDIQDRERQKPVILLAEDSITTRTQEKRILEGAGYEVVTAVDGMDAFNKLASRPFDIVISDVQMPNMDGLTLTEKIRQNKNYKELPVILVTSLTSDEDRRRGLQVGADAYITKPTFDQSVFLETVGRLI